MNNDPRAARRLRIAPFRLGLALALAALLAACGGGGGGGGGPPSPHLSLDKTTLTFASADFSTPPAAQTVVVTFVGAELLVGTLPGTTLPPWLSVSAPSMSSSPVTVTVSINAVSLVPGRNSTTLRFVTGNADGTGIVTQDLTVTYTIDHVLSPTSLELAATAGAAGAAPAGTVTVTTAGADWRASADQPWLGVAPASGTGTATLTVTATPGALPAGLYSGTVTVTDTLTMRARTVAVNLSVEPRRLVALERGVALSSTLGSSRLSHAVAVLDTAGLGGPWAASSDAAWLTASPASGSGGTSVALTADPSGLADGLYYATVTLAPNGAAGLTNNETIRVGFYVDHATPAPPDVLTTPDIKGGMDAVVDPIRPYVYVSKLFYDNTIMTDSGEVAAYNVYTGAPVAALPFPGQLLGRLAIAADGSQLLVVNRTAGTIVPMTWQGAALVAGTPWTTPRQVNNSGLAYTRVGGTDVVLSGALQILAPSTGTVLAEFQGTDPQFAQSGAYVAAAADGGSAFLMSQSGGNHLVSRLHLSGATGTPRAIATKAFNEGSDAEDIVVSRDTTRLITLSGNFAVPANNLLVYDSASLAPVTGAQVGGQSLDVTSNGSIYVTDSFATFTQYDAQLSRIGQRSLDPANNRLLRGRISSDEQRAVVITIPAGGTGAVYLTLFSATLPP